MSSIRKDGVYQALPGASGWNLEKIRFLNDTEVIASNSMNLSFDSYKYGSKNIEFGKYSVQNNTSIQIVFENNKNCNGVIQGRANGDSLRLVLNGSELSYNFVEIKKYEDHEKNKLLFGCGCMAVLLIGAVLASLFFSH